MDVKVTQLNTEFSEAASWTLVGDVAVQEPSKILLDMAPEDIQQLSRDGSDLVIETVDGRSIKIIDFYADSGAGTSELYLVDENGEIVWAQLQPAADGGIVAAEYIPQGEMADFGMVTGAESESDKSAGWAILGGVGAAGLIAGVASAGSSGGSGSDDDNGSGGVDTIAPDAPTDVDVSDDGTTVTGRGEPGTVVTVTDPDGNVVGEGTVGDDGQFTVDVDPPQTDGESLEVVVTDEAGNESEPTNVTAPDTTAPDAPTDVTVSDDGTTVTGGGEPGATVTVTDSDGNVVGEGTVGDDGQFAVDVDPAQTDGESLEVVQTDAAGNESEPTNVTAPDTTAPDAPTDVAVSDDGTTVTGGGEPGATVTVTDPDGNVVGDGTVDDDGQFTVDVDPAQTDGESLEVVQTDAAGNESEPTNVTAPDTTAPDAPTDVAVSDDGTTVTGGGEPGATVTVTDPDGNVVGDGTVDDDGQFTVDVDPAQTDGESLEVVQTDAAGNESEPTNVTAPDTDAPGDPDTTAPDAPSNVTVSDDGTTVTGGGEPGATVTVTDPDGNVIGEATVGDDGQFAVDVDPAQTDGESLEVVQADAAGNESEPTNVIAPDTTAPDAPSDVTVSDDGSIVTGTGEPGATVSVTDPDGNVIGEATVTEDGQFTVDVDPAQTNGEALEVVQTDGAGNESDPTAATAPDTTAPDAPVVNESDGTLLTGTAEAGSTVDIDIDGDGTPDYSTSADPEGNWSVALDPALADETEVSVTATDEAGNISDPTTIVTDADLVDTTPPAVPVISALDDVDPVQGSLESGDSTNDTLPTLMGTAEAGSTVEIFQNGTSLGTVTADASGNWSYTPATELVDGSYSFTATATDGAGNVSDISTAFELAIDTTAPVVDLDSGSVSDGVDGLTGTVDDPEAVITVTVNGTEYTAINNGDGTWTQPDDSLSAVLPGDEAVIITVTATDPAGNAGTVDLIIEVDPTTPPGDSSIGFDDSLLNAEEATSVTLSGQLDSGSVFDSITISDGTTDIVVAVADINIDADGVVTIAGQDLSSLADGEITVTAEGTNSAGDPISVTDTTTLDATAPDAPVVNDSDGALLTGTAEAGSTIDIDVNGDGTPDNTVIADVDGSWSVALDPALPDGTEVSVTASDEAGNTSGPATITTDADLADTTPPTAPIISAVDDVDPVQGNLESGDSTNDTQPTLTGSAEAGSTVEIFQDGTSIGTAIADASGNWNYTPVAGLTDNTYSFTATATDVAGNVSDPSDTFELTIDTAAPGTPAEVAVNDDGTAVTGEGEPGATVSVTNPDGTVIGSGTVGDDGQFTVDVAPPQTNGEALEVVQADAAGNTSDPATATAPTPDTTAPDAPTNVAVNDDGTVVTGEGEPGATVTVTDPDGNVIGEGAAGDDGQFAVDVDPAQTNGEALEVVQTDGAGNESDPTNVAAPDTTAPDAPANVAVNDDGTVVTGEGEPGATVTVTDPDGAAIGSGTVGDDGQFAVDVDPAQTNGEALEVVQTDGAGNESDPTAATAPDTTAPDAPVVNESDGTLLTGTAEAGSTVDIDVDGDGTPDYSTSADPEGNWSVALDPALADETEVSVTATDEAGNISDPTTIVTDADLVDTTPPAVPVISAVDDVDPVQGDLATGDSTNDTLPTLMGTAEADSTVEIFQNGTSLGTVTADASGNWSYTPATELADGDYSFTATATDDAGNVSDTSAAFELTIDTAAPSTPTEVAVNDDGTVVTGEGEPGATVTVTDSDGAVIGSGTVGDDGQFAVDVDPSQTNGEALEVVQADAAGNISDPATATAPDTTAPDAPANVAVNDDGTVVTGEGEPGATVTVTDADGNVIGEGTAGDDGQFAVDVDPAQTNGEALEVVQADPAGNESDPTNVTAPDTTAPDAPANVAVNDDGTVVTGEGEPGATVTVTDADGNVIGEGTAGDDGQFAVDVDPAQTNGEALEVVQADPAGNESDPTNVTAPDTTAPDAPANVAVNDDGTVVTGEGEPGATVTVTDPDGAAIGSGTVGDDGQFAVDVDPAQTNGEALEVVQTDGAGNESDPTNVAAPDTTAPDAPANVAVNDDGTVVTGEGEPGATVTVTDPDGAAIGSGTVGDDGQFAVDVDPAQTNGEALEVVQTDGAGNESDPTNVAAPDTTAPDAPANVAVNDDGTVVTGEGEPGATVTVTDPDGAAIGSGTVGDDGQFAVDVDPAQTNGEALEVVQTDGAGNESDPTNVAAPDTTAPDAPANVAVNDDGTVVTGEGEPGATVTVTDPDGAAIGSGTVGDDGQFAVDVDPAQTNGEALEVVQTDGAGNESDPTNVAAPDTTAPDAPANVAVNDDGTVVTGEGEPGATVTVTDPDGAAIGSGTVGDDGQFAVDVDPAQTNGEALEVVQTDGAGNESDPTNVAAPDTTAPDAPANVAVNDDGTVVTGEGEPGATVTVTDPDGAAIGSGTVGDDGQFAVDVDPAQTNGEALEAVQTDGAGNESDPTNVAAPDTTAPDAPANVAVNDDGTVVTGEGEPGATVTVTDPDGAAIGSGTVGDDGQFAVDVDPAQTNGEALEAVQTDGAGNESDPTNVAAPDTTAPDAPANVAVNDDGTVVTGEGEPGATVTVTDPDGAAIGSGTVGDDGQFAVDVDPAQTNGEALEAVQTDGAGNESDPTNVAAPDTTAPDAPANVAVNDDGTVVTGEGEPGATVTVTDPDGAAIGSGTVGDDGQFAVDVDPAQTNGEALEVVQTDGAGNESDPTNVAAPDTTAPDAPANVAVNDDGTVVTGEGEPGATVTVTDADGNVVGEGTAGDDGQFAVDVDPAQTNGEALEVVQADPAGNESDPTNVTAPDTTAPDAPANVAVNDDGTVVTGEGEPGATVTVTDPDGAAIGSGTVGDDGQFAVDVDPAQTNGEALEVVQTDGAGNESDPTNVAAPDTTAPDAPANVAVNDDGTVVTGEGEPGATVTVTDPDGAAIGSGTVGDDGQFAVDVDPAQTNGEALEVVQTDGAGNESDPTNVAAPDTTAPDAPANVAVNDDGTVVTGEGEPGATVTVTDPDGAAIGSGTVGDDGQFAVDVDPAQTNGEALEVVQTDGAGNESDPTNVAAPDTTAPDAPANVAVNDDGTVVTGEGEPGATVTVTDPDGAAIGSGTVGDDGQFAVDVDPAQTNGEALEVVQTDGAGNESDPTNVAAPDTTAPDAPANVAVNDDGTVVTGEGEPGATVTVTDPDGAAIGSGTVGDDGQFAVDVDPAQTNGEALEVVQTDGAGNESDPTNVAAPDTTAPDAPANVAVNDDGTVVTGEGEPGATVTVTDPDGAAIGSGTVGDDGQFAVDVDPAQTNGEALEVVQTDGAGNESDPTAATAPDTTAPDAPVVNESDGTLLTGTAEAGSTVDIDVDGDGTPDYTTSADPEGNWSVALDPALADETEVSVTATDEAGNISDPTTIVTDADLVDTTPPAVPVISAVDDVDPVQGDLASGDSTNDNQPELQGSGEAGSTVEIFQNGVSLGTVIADASGNWSYTPDAALADGDYSFTATATDSAGNVSDTSAAFELNVDTVSPDAPTIALISDTGVDGDGITSEGAVAVSGLESDTTWEYTTDGGTTWAAGSGDSFALPEGVYADGAVQVRQTDAAGNVGDTASLGAVEVDATLPAAPTIALSNDTGVDGDGITSEGVVTVSGLEPDATWEYTTDGGTTWETGAGDSFALPEDVYADGVVQVRQVDVAGNTSDTASLGAITVDTTGPSDGDGSNSIAFDDGGDELLSADEVGSVTLSGQLEAGSSITALAISDGTDTITVDAADISVDADGVVSVVGQDLSSLADGELTVTATVSDAAGNSGTITDTTSLDATAPTVALDPLTTNDTTPALSGTVDDPAATITVTVDGTDYDATNNGDGSWSLADDTLAALPEGDNTITVTATDAAGNETAVDATVSVDTTGPSDGDGSNSIAFDDGGDELLSADEVGSVTLSGQLEAGSSITALAISDGTDTITVDAADISVDADGVVSVVGQDLSSLADGELTVTATVSDAAGNSGTITDTTSLDATAPTVALDPLTTNDTTPALSGTVDDPAATITVTVDGTDYDATNNGDGSWSLADDTLAALPEGDNTITVTATDAAGNETAVDATVSVDTTGPSDGDGSNSIAFDDGGDELLSADEVGSVTLSGQLEAGSSITALAISDGTDTITVDAADISVDADGVVSVIGQDLSSLADGELTVTATVSDAAGNSGTITDTTSLDATAPTVALDPLTTNDTTPALSGTVDDPAATITVTVDGTDYDATNNGDGSWSLADDTLAALPEGDNTITVTATDAAGNETAVDATVSVDTTGPSDGDGSNSIAFDDGGDELLSADEVGSVTLSGQLEAGSSITALAISDGTDTITVDAADITVSDTGVVTVAGQDLSGLADGEITVTAEVTDAAGNSGTITDTTSLDATAPTVALDPLTTNDTTPALSGTVDDPAATITVTVDGIDYDATNNGDGSWSLADDTLAALPEGDTEITVTATDAAGNETVVTEAITVDTTGPSDGDGSNSIAFDDGGDELLSADEVGSVTLSGQLEAGSSITALAISDGTDTITVDAADISVDADGVVSVIGQDLSSLADGELTVTATVSDAAGNSGTITDTTSLDATAPTVALDPLTTNDTTPALSGTVDDPAATITVTVDGTDYDATNNGDGSWSLADDTLAALPEGDNTITVTATDAAGNETAVDATVSVDTTGPSDGDGSNSIAFDDGGDELLSADEVGSVTLSGQLEAGSSITALAISDGTDTITVDAADISVDADGVVSVVGQDLSSLADGELTVTATVSDAAGNSGTITDTTSLDATAPTVALDPLTTNDTTPALSGTVDDPAATITVTVDGTDYDATNNGDGSWSLADDTLAALPEGDNTITVTATDAAGNETAVDATVSVDTTGPSDGDGSNSIAFDDGGDELLSADEVGSVTLSGQLEAGSSITALAISDGTDTITVDAADISVDADGVVSVVGQDLSSLADGELTVTATVSDAAGNSGTITDTTSLDATAPTVALDPLTTNDTTPALSGTVDDPAATITVTVDGTDYDATNNGDGSWSLADDTLAALSEGDNTITVTATDAAGNETAVDATVSVDTTGPSDGDGSNSIAFDDGGDELLSADEVGSVTLSGQLEAGSSITSLIISDGTTEITVAAADITVDGAGAVTVAGQDL
ncbi:Ig-like domain-containing protein, partial [Halomonas huangheensis]